jgi:hypothetical protein
MAVHVDDAGGDEFARPVDNLRAGGRRETGFDSLDDPVANQDVAPLDPIAFAVQDRRPADQGRRARVADIGGRIRVLIDLDGRWSLGLAFEGRATGDQRYNCKRQPNGPRAR